MPELSGGDLSLFFSAEADTGLGLKLEQRRVRVSRRIIAVELLRRGSGPHNSGKRVIFGGFAPVLELGSRT